MARVGGGSHDIQTSLILPSTSRDPQMPISPAASPDPRLADPHLRYEIDMFRELLPILHDPPPSLAIRNALIESFLLHTRILINFLYPSGSHTDDIVPTTFSSNWSETRSSTPPSLKRVREQANKRLAHLTTLRYKVEPSQRPWPLQTIVTDIGTALVRFAKQTPDDKLSPETRTSIEVLSSWMPSTPRVVTTHAAADTTWPSDHID